ncbi:hypothetical protein AB0F68_30635 [Micromonospora sp. NPDC023966]|uniref:hypothetical protein n=1 Tax=Micromonospora sp. NPDC023966 TaxID=3154699 RepID=UPI0033FFB650
MMQVPGVGALVRALLPVQLTGGFSATLGVWVALDPADLQRASAVWWEPECQDLVPGLTCDLKHALTLFFNPGVSAGEIVLCGLGVSWRRKPATV